MQFRLLGFPVTVQTSVLVLAGVYLLLGLEARNPIPEVVAAVLTIFASILWHELGHAVAARSFGLGPVEITLHGFGGLTFHSRSDRAWKDLVVTLAGPGAGLALGVASLAVLLLLPLPGLAGFVITQLVFVNIFWSLFNLLPMYPLDGGNALSAVLRIFVPAIAWPVTIGLGLAGGVLLGLSALWLSARGEASALFLLFVAGMIVNANLQMRKQWIAAKAEAARAA